MTKKLNIAPINTWINDDSDPLIISGPCSAETFDQLYETCKQLDHLSSTILSTYLSHDSFDVSTISSHVSYKVFKISTSNLSPSIAFLLFL